MYNFTILMALVDYIPVIFFGIAAALLQWDLYNKMRKEAFALFAAGTINIFAAGFLKATWKLLYAAGICDFQALNTMFLPVQSIGFLLAGLGHHTDALPPQDIPAGSTACIQRQRHLHHDDGAGSWQHLHGSQHSRRKAPEKNGYAPVPSGISGIHGHGRYGRTGCDPSLGQLGGTKH